MGHYDDLRQAQAYKQRQEQMDRERLSQKDLEAIINIDIPDILNDVFSEMENIKSEINLIKTILENWGPKNENE